MRRKTWRISFLTRSYVTVVALVAAAAPLAWGAGQHGHGHDGHGHASKAEAGDKQYLFGNRKCPATGDAVVPENPVEYRDESKRIYGRLYICCKGCAKKTRKKAAELYKKYYRTDPKTGKERGPIDLKNPKCPLTGNAVADNSWIEYNGMIVHFCCDDCIGGFLKDPDSKLAKMVKNPEDYRYKRPAGSGSSR